MNAQAPIFCILRPHSLSLPISRPGAEIAFHELLQMDTKRLNGRVNLQLIYRVPTNCIELLALPARALSVSCRFSWSAPPNPVRLRGRQTIKHIDVNHRGPTDDFVK